MMAKQRRKRREALGEPLVPALVVLSSESSRTLLFALAGQEASAPELADQLGRSPSTVRAQLHKLMDCDLVKRRKVGRCFVFRLGKRITIIRGRARTHMKLELRGGYKLTLSADSPI